MPDFPVILSFGNIANFLECIAMFNFVKRLSALRIVAKPFTDRFPLSDSFAIFLHYVLDVCCFGRGNAQPLGRAHNFGACRRSYSELYLGKPSQSTQRQRSTAENLCCAPVNSVSLYWDHPRRQPCRPAPLSGFLWIYCHVVICRLRYADFLFCILHPDCRMPRASKGKKKGRLLRL